MLFLLLDTRVLNDIYNGASVMKKDVKPFVLEKLPPIKVDIDDKVFG